MSKPANKRLIGVFVLGAIALLVIAVVVLGSGKFFRKTFKAVCFFEGSVGGLSVGAPVVFNGVRIGEVTDVVLRYDTRDLTATIPVYIEIDPQRMETVGPRPTEFRRGSKTFDRPRAEGPAGITEHCHGKTPGRASVFIPIGL